MNTETYIMTEGDKSYRMLQVGETLEAGDEWKYEGKWYKQRGAIGQRIGEKDDIHPQGYYRRPIYPATDPSNVLPAIAEARL